MLDLPPLARFGGLVATGLRDVTSDPAALDSTGFWAVSADFEGRLICARFGDVREEPVPAPVPGRWRGPSAGDWKSSLDRAAYTAGVRRIREHIAAGEVYQANLCRVLSAPVAPDADVDALTALLARGNPAPYAGTIRLPGHGVEIATASPELFLSRGGRVVESGPIKGTGRTEADLLEKDYAENVMIVDLVRNDIGRVCATGTVTVPDLCVVEKHPGLVHLVSTVHGELRYDVGWPELLAAAFPPGSVTGAPKSSALRIIEALETAPRGPYCGGIGWVDADRGTGELAVGIRTFWIDREEGVLRFGTGAGITWGSDPEGEWRETELKASRLLAVASGTYEASGETLTSCVHPADAAGDRGSAVGRPPGRKDTSDDASGTFLRGRHQ
ncbi:MULTISPECIES: chorismate-binding protein [Streptomyces]|uniref:Chloride transporter n=1 Tax=Streptomyces dengpaensis TaxID=2049881 RepID=A0ABN5I9Y4_9ACTN|nr:MULTISPECIES: chorismate-binding protein [Streptomyces]AVH59811.1 chloride transporter [Streptomyces dengpaensis]PIB09450.1 chloride transporter [Streptomyces sp. HG99]